MKWIDVYSVSFNGLTICVAGFVHNNLQQRKADLKGTSQTQGAETSASRYGIDVKWRLKRERRCVCDTANGTIRYSQCKVPADHDILETLKRKHPHLHF